MIEHRVDEAADRTLREAKAELARLEDQNRAVRSELDLVLSSKALRALAIASHPIWALRSAWALLLGWKPIARPRELWRDWRVHRIPLSTVAPDAGSTGSLTWGSDPQWTPELRIGGEKHDALHCRTDSPFTFRAAVGRGARLRAYCAILPQRWELCSGGVQFVARAGFTTDVGPAFRRTTGRLKPASTNCEAPASTDCEAPASTDCETSASVGSAGHDAAEARTASRTLDPTTTWRDRRWHSISIDLPRAATGDVIVTLDTRAVQRIGGTRAGAVWGDPVLEWPRSRDERRRLLRGAWQRLRWSGLSGALEYALGRQYLENQAAAYAQWIQVHQLDEGSLTRLRTEVAALPYRPLISVVTPLYNTPPDLLAACIESVRRQAYERWELCLADDASTSEATRSVLRKYSDDPRVRVARLEQNANISAASNAALALASGELVAFLDHDDELAPEALAEVVRHLNAKPDADVIYSDEDKLDESGTRCDPHFKPDWSPDLFLSYMYTCHLMVVRRQLVQEIGGLRTGFEGAQDYDLLLRLTERTNRIHHIPRILYHWRKGAASTASLGTIKPWALEAGRRALEDYARRHDQNAEVLPGKHPGLYRLRRAIRGQPLVSIVIPTTGRPRARGEDLLARCLRSLAKTTWRPLEVVLAADRGEMSEAARTALEALPHRIVAYEPRVPFNFPHKVNLAVRHAAGEHVVFFNDDLEVLAPEWLTAMLEHSQDPAVGAVGAKLHYPDGRLQHIGMLLGVCGVAAHAFHRYPGQSPGYFGSAITVRNCSAVTAACLMTRRAIFEEVGGFDEELPVDFNDVDFCLRIRGAGYRIVFTPYAELCHHESASFGRRGQDTRELARMRERWGRTLEQDPYYNPNLSRNFSDYRLQL